MTEKTEAPHMMTVREIARTGLLPECALRRLVAEGRIPVVRIGRKFLINYTQLCKLLEKEV